MCDPERLGYFKELVRFRYSQLLNGEFAADPINLFVKQEPHKRKKIEQERYRLISGVSVVDTFVDRILFGPLARKALQTVCKTPCMVGWVPIQGGYRYLNGLFPGETLSLDKEMWDWSVRKWLIRLWYQFLTEMNVNPTEWWARMVLMRFYMLFNFATFEFEDGLQVIQPGWGVMKSGCYLTLLLNSVGQSMVHYKAQLSLGRPMTECEPVSMGDDTLQEVPEDLEAYVEAIRATGAIPKEPKVTPWIEFAGFIIEKNRCYPAYWRKHMFKIKHVDPQYVEEVLDAFQQLYAHEPHMLQVVHHNIRKLCPHIYVGMGILRKVFDGAIRC